MVFTVDIEDFWHALLPSSQWNQQESHVEHLTLRLLMILDDAKVRGRFYMLGHIAKHHPRLSEQILACGHQLGSHGYWHEHGEREGDTMDFVTRQLLPVPVQHYRSPFWDTTKRPGRSGGAFFRILPYPVFLHNLQHSGVFWLHPHDLDVRQPSWVPLRRKIGVKNAENRLWRLLKDVRFDAPDRA